MQFNAGDMCRLAADLAAEHGHSACDYARRAVASFESEGAPDRAQFWFMLSVLLDDIMLQRLDPEAPITIH
ncbi:MAG TPA: hypothetical protein VG819_00360 [Rhizomicrobium sp.]|jgi:hypothetical protein|nr:hypothetical protein [Rhizomicrobium sp.]